MSVLTTIRPRLQVCTFSLPLMTAHNTDLCSAQRSSTETKQQDDIFEQHLSSIYAVVARR
jgi:hypothetical protein